MTVTKMDLVTGEVVMFNSTLCKHDDLVALCDAFGHEVRWLAMPANAALTKALRYLYLDGGKVLVRKGANNTICVVRERTDEDGNKYDSKMVFRVDDDFVVDMVAVHGGYDASVEAAVQAKTNDFRGKVSAGNVTNGCAATLIDEFGGHAMRARGGCYFVPSTNLAEWDRWAQAFEMQTGNVINRIQSGVDANTAAAVAREAERDLGSRYKNAIAKLNGIVDNDGMTQAKLKSNEKRRKVLVEELQQIRKIAANMDAAFGNATSVAKSVEEGIEIEMAMALL